MKNTERKKHSLDTGQNKCLKDPGASRVISELEMPLKECSVHYQDPGQCWSPVMSTRSCGHLLFQWLFGKANFSWVGELFQLYLVPKSKTTGSIWKSKNSTPNLTKSQNQYCWVYNSIRRQTTQFKNGQQIWIDTSPKKNIQLDNKYMKRCSTSLVTREM